MNFQCGSFCEVQNGHPGYLTDLMYWELQPAFCSLQVQNCRSEQGGGPLWLWSHEDRLALQSPETFGAKHRASGRDCPWRWLWVGSWAFGRGSRDPGLFPKELHRLRRRVPGRVGCGPPHRDSTSTKSWSRISNDFRCPKMPVIVQQLRKIFMEPWVRRRWCGTLRTKSSRMEMKTKLIRCFPNPNSSMIQHVRRFPHHPPPIKKLVYSFGDPRIWCSVRLWIVNDR